MFFGVMQNKLNLILIFIFALIFLPLNLFAVGDTIDISNKNSDEARILVKNTLEKLGASYSELDETNGFRYRFKDNLFTPYDFDIFIGRYAENSTLIRSDGPYRMGFAMSDIFRQENGTTTFQKSYSTKSVLLTDFLILLSPGFGHYYANRNTPVGDRNNFMTSLIYTGVDLILLWVGGKTFFFHSFDPLDRGIIATSVLLAGHRLFHILPHHFQVSTHNRMVNLQYKFRY